jgi:small subunit ribosomal protein S35
VRHEFPKEWVLTEERKKYLEESREKKQRLDYEKSNNGELLDGSKIIATALPFTYPTAEPVPVLVGKSKR